MQLSARRTRGFTLLELGVVLGVSAVLAAALLPDIVEASRTKMAERAAEQVESIRDAARAYFVQSAGSVGGSIPPNTWPGQRSSLLCNLNPSTDPISLLVGQGLLPGRPDHPWSNEGSTYSVSLRTPPLNGGTGCILQLTTDIPVALANGFVNALPQSGCNSGSTPNFCQVTGSPPVPAFPVLDPSRFTRCCVLVPKPGVGVVNGCPSPKSLVTDPITGSVSCN
ncbi:MAG: type II secretion system protein [Deltaproteobacteria bacterium]|nr:type II secretion system protein [Deltaproteobacteria bacterium]